MQPLPSSPQAFATLHAKRLSIRVHNPASANRLSNRLPVLRWHTKVAMPGCITKTKRAENTGRQYGHRS